MDEIEISNIIKNILNKDFNFSGSEDDLIFFELDSINYIKYNLILEKHFNVKLTKKEILTINDSIKSIKAKL